MTKIEMIGLFGESGVSSSTYSRWSSANRDDLRAAMETVISVGANPWVFEGDARHFWQFAGGKEIRALHLLDLLQRRALLGEWDLHDWTMGPDDYLDSEVSCLWVGQLADGVTEQTTRRAALLLWAHGNTRYVPHFGGYKGAEYTYIPTDLSSIRGDWDSSWRDGEPA